MEHTPKKRFVLVAGANGELGREYLESYASLNYPCKGISRSNPDMLNIDLLDQRAAKKAVADLPLRGITDLLYIHAIGIAKLEPNDDSDFNGIDDEVYASNVTTFRNFTEPLIKRSRRDRIKLQLCMIGSISDSFNVSLWHSYSSSKNILREDLRLSPGHVVGTCINVSSVNTEIGRNARPFAITSYWLTPKEVVGRSMKFIEEMAENGLHYSEADFFKPSPYFTEDYFFDKPALYRQWQHDTGHEGEPIPHGIRI